MGALSVNWRPDYSPALMRRELDIIQSDLHANAVRLGGRDPGRLLEAAEYAASFPAAVMGNGPAGRTSVRSCCLTKTELHRRVAISIFDTSIGDIYPGRSRVRNGARPSA
jgi:hypothetical protein